MKCLAVAILLLMGISSAHTITMNFAVQVGDSNNTIRVNNTFYTTRRSMHPSRTGEKIRLSNETNTMAGLVSTGAFAGAYIDTNKTRNIANSSTLFCYIWTIPHWTADSTGIMDRLYPGQLLACSSWKIQHWPAISSVHSRFQARNQWQRDYTIAMWIKTTGTGQWECCHREITFF